MKTITTQTKKLTAQQKLENNIDMLNERRFDLQFEIADATATLIEAKWDAPIIQKELESLVMENHKNWHDIFVAEKAAGHNLDYCKCDVV